MEQAAGHIEAAACALSFAAHAGFLGVLAWASAVDARMRLVPGGAVAAGAVLWAAVAAASLASGTSLFWGIRGGSAACAVASGLAGGIVTGGFALACALAIERGRDACALGGGDVRLLALAGMYLGPQGGLSSLAAACLLALAAQGAAAASRRLRASRRRAGRQGGKGGMRTPLLARSFPFAPFISASTAILLVSRWWPS